MERRVEYPISANYCAKWTARDALRELIANMLDSGAPYWCGYRDGVATFSDEGPGFPASCLMLGEGETKGSRQIGQFREGLKLALLTLSRKHVKVALETKGFTVRAELEMTGLGKDGLVLYVDHEKTQPKGTRVLVHCTKQDFDAAVALFLNIVVNGERINLVDVDQEYNCMFDLFPNQTSGGVYVNGLLTQTGKFLFNYSLTGQEFKSAMNRDRTVLDRDEVERGVMDIWHHMDDPARIDRFIKEAVKHKTAYESMMSLSVRRENGELWAERLAKFYGQKAENLVVTNGNRDTEIELIERGKVVINPGMKFPPAISAIACSVFPSANQMYRELMIKAKREAHKAAKKKSDKKVFNYGHYVVEPWENIELALIKKLNQAVSKCVEISESFSSSEFPGYVQLSEPVAGKIYSRLAKLEFFVFTRDTSREGGGASSAACWYRDRIGIKLSYLQNCEPGELCGTILHEYTHAVTGAPDNSRKFENGLTALIGVAVESLVKPKLLFQVQYAGTSPKRAIREEAAHDKASYTTDQIMKAVSRSCETADTWAGSTNIDASRWFSEHKKANEIRWHYLGALFDEYGRPCVSNGTGSSLTMLFQGNDSFNKILEVTISDAKRKQRSASYRKIKVRIVSGTHGGQWIIRSLHENGISFEERGVLSVWPELNERVALLEASELK